MSALRSTWRCRLVLPPLLIFNGLRVGRYASRTLTACLPSALPSHLHAPHVQAMPRSSSSSNELPEADREIATTSRALVEIMGYSTRSSAALTHKGALFVSGVRACARPSGHACTIHTSHAARGTPTRARTRAHYCPFDRAFVRGRSLLLSSHLAGHYSASFWAQTFILAATATSCSSCARWCFQFLPGRAQCRTILRVAFR